jgi:biofilm PGA synthesis N-glycosyltransferase PgaC
MAFLFVPGGLPERYLMDVTNYVVITPVRDEALYIAKTLAAVTSQTLPPTKWIIVDDGSTDGTGDILERAAAIPWITVIHRTNRGHRAPGGGVIDAFYAGYDVVPPTSWQFLVKLDGDLWFDPDYFARCFAKFATEPRLGIGGGTVYQRTHGGLKVDSPHDPPFHVRGATKIYRRPCWQAIAPLVRAPGWDTIDEVTANLHGWTTRTFADIPIVQHKPTGSAEGRWRNSFKNGLANYMTGYHPFFMLAKCAIRSLRRPLILQSVPLLAGFCSGYLTRAPRAANKEVIRYLRRQQLQRLLFRPSIYA